MIKNIKNISRKDFLKKGFSATAVVTTSALAIPQALKASSGQELATLIDLTKCIGCEACVYACQETNSHKYPEPKKPFPEMVPSSRAKPEDWSDKRDITERLTPYNWLFIQRAKVKINGKETDINIPRRCMHCQEPPCVNLCPFGALHKDAKGITRIDENTCMGGAKCRLVCPWNIPQRQSGVGLYLDLLPALGGNGVMYKCDRCYDLVADGKTPACIEACPEGVQIIGPRSEIIGKAHELEKKYSGYIYGENENGGTNTLYVSKVPFSLLNEAVEKGKGKPHLKPVKNVLAGTEALSAAVLIAPLAVLAQRFMKFYRFFKS